MSNYYFFVFFIIFDKFYGKIAIKMMIRSIHFLKTFLANNFLFLFYNKTSKQM